MSTPNAHLSANIVAAQTDAPVSRVQNANLAASRRERFFSPLWFCLLVALGLRIFLVVHTHGVIDGDEALVGIQAERILHGDFPVYFYGQAYMGSLEAYLIAILFALFGSSVWTLRTEPVLLSLAVVWLTWRLARTLTETTSLSRSTRRIFMTVAALCAAIPPLYDGIIEGRTYGGFIEMLVVILLLLISTIRLTSRWFNGASRGELAWRWAGIGFLVGLGFWIYPLIASAVLAAGLWILGRCLLEMRQILRKLCCPSRHRRRHSTGKSALFKYPFLLIYCWIDLWCCDVTAAHTGPPAANRSPSPGVPDGRAAHPLRPLLRFPVLCQFGLRG